MIDIVYWINLQRSPERRKHMNTVFKHPFFVNKRIERIEAHDGKTENVLDWFSIKGKRITLENLQKSFVGTIIDWFNREQIKKDREERRAKYDQLDPLEKIKYCNGRLSLGEYACTLSHLETIRRFSTSPHDIALILEDDTTMDYAKYWRKSIDKVINEAPVDWEIIQLSYISNNHVFNDLYTKNENNDFLDDSLDAYSTGSYIINKSAAIKIINKLFKEEGRYCLDHTYHHVADFLLYGLLRTYIYKFPYFTYRTHNDSLLHPDHLSSHIRSKKYITESYDKMLRLPQQNYRINWINVVIIILYFPSKTIWV